MGKLKVILSTTAGGGSVAGVQSVIGDGVGGTPENVVMSFPDQSEIQAIRPLKTVNNESLEGTGNITIDAGGAVNSVTGDGVGGTAEDVVLSFPNADEVDDSSTTNKFLTQAEKDKIAQNESFIALLQTNKADQSDLDNLSNRVGDNENNISDLQNDKANASDLSSLQSDVQTNSSDIISLQNDKADQSEVDSLSSRVGTNETEIINLTFDLNNKANQSDLDNLDTRVTQNETDILDKISISTVASATAHRGRFFAQGD